MTHRYCRKIVVLAVCLFNFFVVSNAETDNNSEKKLPKLVFSKLEHDFGKHVAGPVLKHTFHFENKGMAPLFIEKVKAG